MTDLAELINWLEKKQPPRPGLVPKTGDWERPYRWVRPEDQVAGQVEPPKLQAQSLDKFAISLVRRNLAQVEHLTEGIREKFGDDEDVNEDMDYISVAYEDALGTLERSDPNWHVLAIVNKKKIEGIITVTQEEIDEKRTLRIDTLGTHPKNYYRIKHSQAIRGVGTALVSAALNKARELELPYLSLEPTNAAAPFYEKLGFQFDKEGHYMWLSTQQMEKQDNSSEEGRFWAIRSRRRSTESGIDVSKQDLSQPDISELDANLQEVDFQVRAFLMDLLEKKAQMERELELQELEVYREMQLRDAVQVIENIIAKIRFHGFYEEDYA